LAQGIKPSDVYLLGIDGGKIAALEYRIALALGAKVGLLEASGRESTNLIYDQDWMDHERLLNLPRDAMTLRAFTNRQLSKPILTNEAVENCAKAVYDIYHQNLLKPWDKLDKEMQWSNYSQVMYMEVVLKSAGYGIREKIINNTKRFEFPPDAVEIMAQMEHGRWNEERLSKGWKYGNEKDVKNKISPYIVAWEKLDESIKEYDRRAVRSWPDILGQINYEIYDLKN